MREIKLTWMQLEEILKKEGVVFSDIRDWRENEHISHITLVSPKKLVIQTNKNPELENNAQK